MRAPPLHYLQSIIPDVDHPDLNAMRNFLHAPKINIPVVLYQGEQIVYAAEVKMIGHGHALYKAALDAVREEIKTRTPAIEWDSVSFHSAKKFSQADMAQGQPTLADYVGVYRKMDFTAAHLDALAHLEKVYDEPDRAAAKLAFEGAIHRLCAAIISTSVEVTPDPAYAPVRKGILHRFMPKF